MTTFGYENDDLNVSNNQKVVLEKCLSIDRKTGRKIVKYIRKFNLVG